jgi:ElaB/YqjD/DUF883 family membrane-anchored ribosome-binding protein
MSVTKISSVPVENTELLDELQKLLERQIELVNRGEPAGKKIENLSEQINILVAKVRQAGILETEQFKNVREKIRKLYDCLYMAVSAQKDQTKKELNRIRKGKKTIVTYRGNI